MLENSDFNVEDKEHKKENGPKCGTWWMRSRRFTFVIFKTKE